MIPDLPYLSCLLMVCLCVWAQFNFCMLHAGTAPSKRQKGRSDGLGLRTEGGPRASLTNNAPGEAGGWFCKRQAVFLSCCHRHAAPCYHGSQPMNHVVCNTGHLCFRGLFQRFWQILPCITFNRLFPPMRAHAAALWGVEGIGNGLLDRQMSLASKLNIPPPVRPLAASTTQHRASIASIGGYQGIMSNTGGLRSFVPASLVLDVRIASV